MMNKVEVPRSLLDQVVMVNCLPPSLDRDARRELVASILKSEVKRMEEEVETDGGGGGSGACCSRIGRGLGG